MTLKSSYSMQMRLHSLKNCFNFRSNHPTRDLNAVMTIDGQISRSEARQLMILAQQVASSSVIVEIGNYRGRSTIALAYGSQLGQCSRIYAIDPHIEFQGVFGGHFGPQDQAIFYQNLIKHGVADLVAVVSLSSLQVAKGWEHSNIGLLFFDGDHQYPALRADYEAWYRFVAQGGYIGFHDSDMPEVHQFLTELIDQEKIIQRGRVDSLSWFQLAENENVCVIV